MPLFSVPSVTSLSISLPSRHISWLSPSVPKSVLREERKARQPAWLQKFPTPVNAHHSSIVWNPVLDAADKSEELPARLADILLIDSLDYQDLSDPMPSKFLLLQTTTCRATRVAADFHSVQRPKISSGNG